MTRSFLFALPIAVAFTLTTPFLGYDNESIVGVWDLVQLTDWSDDGTRTDPFGEKPSGMFIYTPNGHMSIHIMRTPPLPKFTERPDDAGLAEIARAYLAYYGTYSVDADAGIVTHEVEGALNPNYVGTDRERSFSVSGDTLTIEIRRESGAYYLRRLVRTELF